MLVSHAVVGESIERGGGAKWTCRGSPISIRLGLLLLLTLNVGIVGLNMDIVVHIVMGILKIEK